MQQNSNGAESFKNGVELPHLHYRKITAAANLALSNMVSWMVANRLTYPIFFFWAGIVAVGFLLAAIAMHIISTGVGRIVEDIILQAGAGVGLIAFFAVFSTMLWGSIRAGSHVWQTWSECEPEQSDEPKAIPAETHRKWQPLSISPDPPFFQQNGETMAEFAARFSAFTPTMAEWGILIKRGELQATVFTKTKGINFERGYSEPFLEALKETDRRPGANVDFINESQEQYEMYCYWFAMHWPKVAGLKKYEQDMENAHKTAVEILAAQAKAVTVALSLLLFCLPVFGQSKTQQVDAALMQVSGQINPIPPAGAAVTYEFQTGTKAVYIDRKADGKSTYMELLPKSTGIVRYNDAGGELSLIKVNGEPVIQRNKPKLVNVPSKSSEPQPQRIQSPVAPNGAVYLPPNNTGDPVRPYGTLQAPDVANTPVTDEPLNIHIPTPDEVQTTLDNASREIDYRKTEAWAAIKPIWKWIMGMFFSIVPLFICLGGLFRYYAGTAANESFYGLSGIGILIRRVHETASGVTLLICWGIATVLLIDEFMLFVYLGIPLWLMLATWFPSLFLAKVLTNWAVPNPPELAHGRGGYDQPYAGQRRIG